MLKRISIYLLFIVFVVVIIAVFSTKKSSYRTNTDSEYYYYYHSVGEPFRTQGIECEVLDVLDEQIKVKVCNCSDSEMIITGVENVIYYNLNDEWVALYPHDAINIPASEEAPFQQMLKTGESIEMVFPLPFLYKYGKPGDYKIILTYILSTNNQAQFGEWVYFSKE